MQLSVFCRHVNFVRCRRYLYDVTLPTVITDCRADYWKSQGRKFCDFCKCWIADNKPSIDFHEGGKKHKENVSKRLKEIHKNSAKQAKQNKKFADDIKKMENVCICHRRRLRHGGTNDKVTISFLCRRLWLRTWRTSRITREIWLLRKSLKRNWTG